MFCDLHVHSTASDGTIPPAQLARLARSAGLGAIALTDHDTTGGLTQCAAACEEAGVAFVPGIEISADPAIESPHAGQGSESDSPTAVQTASDTSQRRGTLHILGLFVRHDDTELQAIHHRMRDARDSRNPAIVQKLTELGVDIEYDEVLELAAAQGTKIIGRPHIAQVLVTKGYVKTIQAAFASYIGQGAPAYVRRDRLPAAEAIRAIHHAGGLSILAHPVQLGLRDPGALEHFVARLRQVDLDGIETQHSDHDPLLIRQYTALAERFELLTSGGSDFHGSRKSSELGCVPVRMAVYEKLRRAAAAGQSKRAAEQQSRKVEEQ